MVLLIRPTLLICFNINAFVLSNSDGLSFPSYFYHLAAFFSLYCFNYTTKVEKNERDEEVMHAQ